MPSSSLSMLPRDLQMSAGQNSSTEFRPRHGSLWAALAQSARKNLSGAGEVSLFTKGSRSAAPDASPASSRAWMTERNESVSARIIPIRNPNGNDKLKTEAGLLLKDPNTSEIIPFADRRCQQSTVADGQVMDRGAERAAGGCDAI